MRDLENQDYLNIIKSDCVRITDIRTEDDLKLSLGELDDIILGAESIEANEFCEDNQQYCIACVYHEKLVAIDIANITNDKCFFYYAFIGEIYDYEKLISILQGEKVIPYGIIMDNYRKSFKSDSYFAIDNEKIEVTDNSYPYKIYKDQFMYFRYDYNYKQFGLCDKCLYIYYKDGNSVKLCYDD